MGAVGLSGALAATLAVGSAPAGAVAGGYPFGTTTSVVVRPGGGPYGPTTGFKTGDLNHDGAADLVTYHSDGTISVFLGNGDGTFQPRIDASSLASPTSVEIGLVDDDADPDLVVTGTGGFVVLLGNGDGTVAPGLLTTTTASTGGAAIADVDEDSHADVIVTGGAAASALSVFPGTGTGAFGAPVTHATPDLPRKVAAADINGDHHVDLVSTAWISGGFSIVPGLVSTMAGDGHGGFGTRVDLAAAARPDEVAVGDADDDGRPDLAVGYTTANPPSYYPGAAGGTFGARIALASDGFTGSKGDVNLVDLDGDGALDIVRASSEDKVDVNLGDGSGGYGPDVPWQAPGPGTAARVADVDGDGTLDLLQLASNGARITVIDGRGGAIFSANLLYDDGNYATSNIGIGDLNGDGSPDLLSSQPGSKVFIRLNAGDGTYGPPASVASTDETTSPVIADVNGDTKGDVVYANTATKSVVVQLGDGAGGLAAPVSYTSGVALKPLVLADVDGDGDLDVVGTSKASGVVVVLANSGTGTFGPPSNHAVGVGPVDVAVADLGNGHPDIVTANDTAGTVSVLVGSGAGAFAGKVDYAMGAGTSAVRLADLDGDGSADVVTANRLAETMSVRLSSGDGLLEARVDQPVGENATALAVADFDGDTDADIAVADDSGTDGAPYNEARLLYWSGNGDGTFGDRIGHPQFGVGERPRQPSWIGAADLDGDGAADIVAPPAYQNEILLLLSEPAAGVAPSPAPFATWGALVTRIYQRMEGRAPTQPELDSWTAALGDGAATPAGIVAALRRSADNAAHVDPVTRLYRAYFLRIPDAAGLTYWIGRSRSGTPLGDVSGAFAHSGEFKARYGSLSNAAFVDRVYRNVLGRAGDSAGVAFWTKKLDQKKMSRGRVMIGFSESAEYRSANAAEVDAAVLPILLTAKAPTAVDFTAAVAALDGKKATVASLAKVQLGSAGFTAGA